MGDRVNLVMRLLISGSGNTNEVVLERSNTGIGLQYIVLLLFFLGGDIYICLLCGIVIFIYIYIYIFESSYTFYYYMGSA